MEQQLDWNTRIIRAEQKGVFNTDDKMLAGDWKLCKVADVLPLMDDFGDILDHPDKEITSRDIYNKYGSMIEDLGYMFAHAVKTDDIITAKEMAKELDNSSEIYIRLHNKTEPYTEEHSRKLLKQMFSRRDDV